LPLPHGGPSGPCNLSLFMTEQNPASESRQTSASRATGGGLNAELVAVIVAVTQGMPRVLVRDAGHALPAGPFESTHRSLQAGLRSWVEEQTHHPLGYIEQLYTFADRDRANAAGQRIISVSYLGLTREKNRQRARLPAGRTGIAIFPGRIGEKAPPL